MWTIQGVLLGVAEVKLPLHRLPLEEQSKVAGAIYNAITEPPGDKLDDADDQLRRKAVGEVDAFYAKQEVTLKETDKLCVMRSGDDVILQYRLQDVMYAQKPGNSDNKVLFVARSDTFGRAGVVLQMLSTDDADKLIAKLGQALQQQTPPGKEFVNHNSCLPQSEEAQAATLRERPR